jgi:hypothetical protein
MDYAGLARSLKVHAIVTGLSAKRDANLAKANQAIIRKGVSVVDLLSPRERVKAAERGLDRAYQLVAAIEGPKVGTTVNVLQTAAIPDHDLTRLLGAVHGQLSQASETDRTSGTISAGPKPAQIPAKTGLAQPI